MFQNENELNSHFITKHKCTSATNKLTNFSYDSSSKKFKKSPQNQQSNANEFNFSTYVKKLKENMESYVKNKMHLKDNLYEVDTSSSQFKPGNKENYDNQHNNYYGKFDSNYKKKGKANRYDKSNQYYDYYGKYAANNDKYNNQAINYDQYNNNPQYGNEQYYYDKQGYKYYQEEQQYENKGGRKKKIRNEENYEEPKNVKQDIYEEFAESSEIHNTYDDYSRGGANSREHRGTDGGSTQAIQQEEAVPVDGKRSPLAAAPAGGD